MKRTENCIDQAEIASFLYFFSLNIVFYALSSIKQLLTKIYNSAMLTLIKSDKNKKSLGILKR